MNSVKILEKKIHEVAERLLKANTEKKNLQTEINFLEEDNKHTKQLISDNAKLKNDRKTIANRVEKLLKKMDSIKS